MGTHGKKKGTVKRTVALMLAIMLAVTGVNVAALATDTPVLAAGKKGTAKTTVKVSTQKELDKVLKNKSVKKIVIDTDATVQFKIPPKAYRQKKLVVNAPNATVSNKGAFKNIIIKETDTFSEYAKKNVISVSDSNLKLKVKKDASVKRIQLNGVSVKLTVDGSVGRLVVAETSTFTIKGSQDKLSIVVSENAAGSKIESKIPVSVTTAADIEITLKKGAENSVITMDSNDIVASVDNQTMGDVVVIDVEGAKAKIEPGQNVTTDTIGDGKNDDDAKNNDEAKENEADNKDNTGTSNGGSTGGNSGGSTGGSTGGTITPGKKDLSKAGYTLKWQDEFNGTSLNRNDWNVELHEKGWVNSEWQAYVDTEDNIYVKDGNLHIRAIKDGDTYTSGRVNTQNKHDFTYGLFEVTAKVPKGMGFLPAFWMMPTNENLYGQWPRCGEIDCMEVMGQETDKVYGTIHYGNPHREGQETYKLANGNFSDEYHTFSCEWEPGKIRWYVDGILYHTENDWYSKTEGVGTVAYPAPFDQPFYMILNLAVGGSWVGFPDETTSFENAEFVIDSVRAYQKSSYNENVTKPEKEVVLRDPDSTGNYVNNGDFSVKESLTDDSDWKFMTANGGVATAEIINSEDDSKIQIKTTDAGTVDYSVQLVQANVPFEKGATYTVSFDAKASADRNMNVAVKAPDYGYATYWTENTALTTTKKNYSYTFKMTSDSDANGRLEYNMGAAGSTADIEISNVRIDKTASADPDEKEEKTVLADGNYIYNAGFQEGDHNLGYWEIQNASDAQVVVVKDGTDRYLKVSGTNTENQNALTIGQSELALLGAKKYELSFDAKTDSATTIQVTVAGQTYDVPIDSTKSTRVVKVDLSNNQTLENTDITFAIGNVKELIMDNVRLVEDAMIKNGSFDAGLSGFEVYAYSSSMETHVIDSQKEQNAFDITINDAGDADWKIQLKQSGIKLEQGKYYKLSYDAKSSIDRQIRVVLQKDGSADDDWSVYSDESAATASLTGGYQTFTSYFRMTKPTDAKTNLSVCLGKVGENCPTTQHRVCMDNFQLVEISADEMPGVTNLFGDPKFEADYWTNGAVKYWGCTGNDGTTTRVNCYKVDSSAVIEIEKGENENPWDIQFMQKGITLEKGKLYEVSFELLAEGQDADFGIALQNEDGSVQYGYVGAELKKGESNLVSTTLVMNKDTDENTVLAMNLGKLSTGTKLSISNPVLLEVGEVVTTDYNVNLFKNPTFASEDGWLTNIRNGDTVSVGDSEAGTSGEAKFTISNTKAGNFWDVELKQESMVYEAGETYKISFELDTTQARSIQVKGQKNGGDWATYFAQDVAITPENKKYTLEVVSNGSDSAAIFAIDMGVSEDNTFSGDTHTIQMRNLSIQKIKKEETAE